MRSSNWRRSKRSLHSSKASLHEEEEETDTNNQQISQTRNYQQNSQAKQTHLTAPQQQDNFKKSKKPSVAQLSNPENNQTSFKQTTNQARDFSSILQEDSNFSKTSLEPFNKFMDMANTQYKKNPQTVDCYEAPSDQQINQNNYTHVIHVRENIVEHESLLEKQFNLRHLNMALRQTFTINFTQSKAIAFQQLKMASIFDYKKDIQRQKENKKQKDKLEALKRVFLKHIKKELTIETSFRRWFVQKNINLVRPLIRKIAVMSRITHEVALYRFRYLIDNEKYLLTKNSKMRFTQGQKDACDWIKDSYNMINKRLNGPNGLKQKGFAKLKTRLIHCHKLKLALRITSSHWREVEGTAYDRLIEFSKMTNDIIYQIVQNYLDKRAKAYKILGLNNQKMLFKEIKEATIELEELGLKGALGYSDQELLKSLKLNPEQTKLLQEKMTENSENYKKKSQRSIQNPENIPQDQESLNKNQKDSKNPLNRTVEMLKKESPEQKTHSQREMVLVKQKQKIAEMQKQKLKAEQYLKQQQLLLVMESTNALEDSLASKIGQLNNYQRQRDQSLQKLFSMLSYKTGLTTYHSLQKLQQNKEDLEFTDFKIKNIFSKMFFNFRNSKEVAFQKLLKRAQDLEYEVDIQNLDIDLKNKREQNLFSKAISNLQYRQKLLQQKAFRDLNFRVKIGDLKKKRTLTLILFRMRMKRLVGFILLKFKSQIIENQQLFDNEQLAQQQKNMKQQDQAQLEFNIAQQDNEEITKDLQDKIQQLEQDLEFAKQAADQLEKQLEQQQQDRNVDVNGEEQGEQQNSLNLSDPVNVEQTLKSRKPGGQDIQNPLEDQNIGQEQQPGQEEQFYTMNLNDPANAEQTVRSRKPRNLNSDQEQNQNIDQGDDEFMMNIEDPQNIKKNVQNRPPAPEKKDNEGDNMTLADPALQQQGDDYIMNLNDPSSLQKRAQNKPPKGQNPEQYGQNQNQDFNQDFNGDFSPNQDNDKVQQKEDQPNSNQNPTQQDQQRALFLLGNIFLKREAGNQQKSIDQLAQEELLQKKEKEDKLKRLLYKMSNLGYSQDSPARDWSTDKQLALLKLSYKKQEVYRLMNEDANKFFIHFIYRKLSNLSHRAFTILRRNSTIQIKNHQDALKKSVFVQILQFNLKEKAKRALSSLVMRNRYMNLQQSNIANFSNLINKMMIRRLQWGFERVLVEHSIFLYRLHSNSLYKWKLANQEGKFLAREERVMNMTRQLVRMEHFLSKIRIKQSKKAFKKINQIATMDREQYLLKKKISRQKKILITLFNRRLKFSFFQIQQSNVQNSVLRYLKQQRDQEGTLDQAPLGFLNRQNLKRFKRDPFRRDVLLKGQKAEPKQDDEN